MARRKSPFSGLTRMPSRPKMEPFPKLPKMEPFPKRPYRPTRRPPDDDNWDDNSDNPDDGDIPQPDTPEDIAERKQKAEQDKFFWDTMIGIWVIKPYEMMKYIFNRLFKRRYTSIGIGHVISVVIWLIILWIISELYLNREQILEFNEYIVTRLLVFGGIITATYFYCKILAWWKFR